MEAIGIRTAGSAPRGSRGSTRVALIAREVTAQTSGGS